MSVHDNEPLHHESIVPERDEVASRQRSKATGRQRPSEPERERDAATGPAAERRGAGPLVWLLALVALAGVGWAGYLQLQLAEAQSQMASYQLRVEDLESRLSVTDESVNQSSLAMQVKIKELDGEIRKLWDNVWKKTQQTLEQHSGQLAKLEKSVTAIQGATGGVEKKLTQQGEAIAELRKQSDRYAKAEATGELNKRKLEEQQVALEAVTEKLGRMATDQTRLAQRVGTNEEWVQSINNFRKQTNRELVNLKQQVSGAPAPLEPLAP